MFEDVEIQNNKKTSDKNANPLNSFAKFSFISFLVAFFCNTFNATCSLAFLYNELSFMLYFATLLSITAGFLTLSILAALAKPPLKIISILSILVIALNIAHIATLIWTGNELRGFESILLILIVPLGLIVALIGIMFLAESIFLWINILCEAKSKKFSKKK